MPAVAVANAARTAAANAGNLEQQGKSKQSGLDVWTHTGAAMRDRMDSGKMYDRASPEMKDALTDFSKWHGTSTDAFASGMGQQWDKVSDDFLNMVGLGDPKKNPEGVLQNVGAFFGMLTSVEQLLTSWVGMIPFPAMPALRVFDLAVGLPHGHAHPPTFGTPLPSIGPILPIPFISGANTVLINGMPAARCGDMGIGVWCGGYVPIFELFLGSSSVWIEGARAGRLLCDVTTHCIFSKRPGPKDPPVGPFVGTTIIASGNVAVGGFPLPSLVSAAMGLAFKAMFKGLAKAFRSVRNKFGRTASHMADGPSGPKSQPILPVTGECFDEYVDFELRTAVQLTWRRYYFSTWRDQDGPYGFGYQHEYQRELRFTGRSWIYVDPARQKVEFVTREPSTTGVASDGMLLRRHADNVFEIFEPGQPTMVFKFKPGERSAPLASLYQGDTVAEFRYDLDDRLTAVEIGSETLRLRYDNQGHIVELEHVKRAQSQTLAKYNYNVADCLTRWTDALGHAEQYTYDGLRQLDVYTTRRGFKFYHEYDNQGRCTREWGEDGLHDVRMEYLPEEFKTVCHHADGTTEVLRYNTEGIITEHTDSYEGVTQYILNDDGKVVQDIDPAGNVMEWLYDDLEGHIGRRDQLGNIYPPIKQQPYVVKPPAYEFPETPAEWDFGKLLARRNGAIEISDPLLHGLPASVINAVAGPIRNGNLDSETANTTLESSAQESYDLLGGLVEKKYPDNTFERWKRDPVGNVIEHRDRDGAVHRNFYDSWRSLKQAVSPTGAVTSYEYTIREYTTKIVDPGGTASEFIYDHNDRIVEVRRHDRVKEKYTYDAADNMVAKTDGNGQVLMEWEIGPGGVDKVIRLGSGEEYVLEHDENGRIVAARTDEFELESQHDPFGRRLNDLRDGRGVTHEYRGDHLASTSYLDKFPVQYQCEGPRKLTITDPSGRQHKFATTTGLLLWTLPNGSRELCQYDAAGRCLSKHLIRKDLSKTWSRTYTYSAVGDLLQVQDSERGTTTYQYDAAHRLKLETLPDGTVRRFDRDPADNLIQQPGLEDVRMQQGNRLTEANGDTFEYNHRNSVVARRGRAGEVCYEYNSLDMLAACDINGEAWTAEYDPLRRRVKKTWQGRTTEYFWDGTRLAAEMRTNESLRLYVYLDEQALVPFMFVEYDDLDAEPESGRAYYVFTNQIGAPIHVEDALGQEVWSARLDPFGQAHIDPSSTIEMPLRFPGHYYDAEVNLNNNWHRYYSSELGRFLQSDPIGPAGGLNLYAYCPNPLNVVDLDGLAHNGKKPGSGKGEGPRKHPGGKAGKQKPQLLAEDLADHLRKNPPDDGLPATVTVVRNKRTGKIYTGTSGKPKLDPSDAHTDLDMPEVPKKRKPKQGKGGLSPAQADQQGNPNWDPNNCAEPKAINEALQDGAKKSDLQVATVDTQTGLPKACCKWCQQTTKGTTVLTE